MTISQAEAFARIRLLRSPNVGPVSYAQLLRRFGNAPSAIEALPDLAVQRHARALRDDDRPKLQTKLLDLWQKPRQQRHGMIGDRL